jgi:hypothetical protein
MQENQKKFLQTRNTPCMREPLRSALGSIGETDACKEILRGTYNPPPHTPISTRELLAQLNKPQAFISPPPPAQVTTAMFQEGWKK